MLTGSGTHGNPPPGPGDRCAAGLLPPHTPRGRASAPAGPVPGWHSSWLTQAWNPGPVLLCAGWGAAALRAGLRPRGSLRLCLRSWGLPVGTSGETHAALRQSSPTPRRANPAASPGSRPRGGACPWLPGGDGPPVRRPGSQPAVWPWPSYSGSLCLVLTVGTHVPTRAGATRARAFPPPPSLAALRPAAVGQTIRRAGAGTRAPQPPRPERQQCSGRTGVPRPSPVAAAAWDPDPQDTGSLLPQSGFTRPTIRPAPASSCSRLTSWRRGWRSGGSFSCPPEHGHCRRQGALSPGPALLSPSVGSALRLSKDNVWRGLEVSGQ